MKSLTRIGTIVTVLSTLATYAAAQSTQVEQTRAFGPRFGTVGVTQKQISAASFRPQDSNSPFTWTIANPLLLTVPPPLNATWFVAGLELPDGALLSTLRIDACDDSGLSAGVNATVIATDQVGNQTYQALFLSTSGGGCESITESLVSDGVTIDNASFHYFLEVLIDRPPASNVIGLAGLVVGYQLQISPAPPTSDFGDVPVDSPQFQFIEALYHSGITAGCGGSNYCPDSPLTRGQMAVFLAKALGLYGD